MRKAFRLAKQVEVGSQQIGFRKESHRTKQVGVAEAVPEKASQQSHYFSKIFLLY